MARRSWHRTGHLVAPHQQHDGHCAFLSFDFGHVHFASLCVPTLTLFPELEHLGLGPGRVQWQWLSNDLVFTDRPWHAVFLHCPLFLSGGHRFDDFTFNGVPDRLEL
jgi:hypothetical protein